LSIRINTAPRRPWFSLFPVTAPPPPTPTADSAALVLAADDPGALARFYGGVLAVEPQPGFSAQHWWLPLPGGARLEIYAPSRARPLPRGRGRLGLCLRLAGGAAALEAAVEAALALGAQPLEPSRQEAFGQEAWLLDPEGNGLLLLAPAP